MNMTFHAVNMSQSKGDETVIFQPMSWDRNILSVFEMPWKVAMCCHYVSELVESNLKYPNTAKPHLMYSPSAAKARFNSL